MQLSSVYYSLTRLTHVGLYTHQHWCKSGLRLFQYFSIQPGLVLISVNMLPSVNYLRLCNYLWLFVQQLVAHLTVELLDLVHHWTLPYHCRQQSLAQQGPTTWTQLETTLVLETTPESSGPQSSDKRFFTEGDFQRFWHEYIHTLHSRMRSHLKQTKFIVERWKGNEACCLMSHLGELNSS